MVDIELKFFYLLSAKQEKPTVPGGGYVSWLCPPRRDEEPVEDSTR